MPFNLIMVTLRELQAGVATGQNCIEVIIIYNGYLWILKKCMRSNVDPFPIRDRGSAWWSKSNNLLIQIEVSDYPKFKISIFLIYIENQTLKKQPHIQTHSNMFVAKKCDFHFYH